MNVREKRGFAVKMYTLLQLQGRFRLDIRERYLTERVAEHWNRIAEELVVAL